MNQILEYITTNYTWIFAALIIILLAIIGSYADKTNFGQGNKIDKTSDEPEDFKKKLENKKISDFVEQENKTDESTIEESDADEKDSSKEKAVEDARQSENKTETTNEEANAMTADSSINVNNEIKASEETIKEENDDSADEQYEQLNELFDEVLPEKSIVTGELLDEIDNLSFDKSTKASDDSMSDTIDLDLPKIKDLKSVDEDIWKF